MKEEEEARHRLTFFEPDKFRFGLGFRAASSVQERWIARHIRDFQI